MTLGRADHQGDLFDEVVRFCEESLPENSIYGFLARERDRLFSMRCSPTYSPRGGVVRCHRR